MNINVSNSTQPVLPADGAIARGAWRYENVLVVILALGGAVAALDGQALFYLGPFIATDLQLSNAQVGVVASVVLLTWSLSGYVVGAISDRTQRRKPYLVATFLIFALCSCLSGLAASFFWLFAARMLIGFAEGPVIPISQSLMMLESSPARRGFNMGITQNLGAQLVGSLLAPIVLVKIASEFSWHAAFYVAAVPALIVAVLVAVFVREPAPILGGAVSAANSTSLWEQLWRLLRYRNIRFCLAISCCLVSWYFLLLTFLPLYCVRSLGLTPQRMSFVMGAIGAAGVVSAVLVPALSDRYGRKPIMAAFMFGAIAAPLAPLWFGSDLVTLVALVFVGALACGAVPLFMATVPLETVGGSDAATATGLIMGIGQTIGGFCGPALGGLMADRFGLAVPLWIAVMAAVAAGVLALCLTETAQHARRGVSVG